MKVNESKGLTKGTRVYWRGDAADSGIITDISWDAVTITSGRVTSVHHGICDIHRVATKTIPWKGSRNIAGLNSFK
jgi:hypothetical protein